ncbi:hypothetical protein GH5_08112 [Leishmania sp. Ghana 2012 LV757]|uniref:hypothetical protein n=1 Tax=Leishmania sp. Ghana 2012 LV757 TaxID=2803181 RepID=UPI001B416DB2|nr:hypothetical protein GH5_08112 [Leishmania sp. Ghana 2012 LV757]
MGGVCSRPKTKSVKRDEGSVADAGATKNIASSLKAPNAGAASTASLNSRRPVAPLNGGAGGTRANVSPQPLRDSPSTRSTSDETQSSGANSPLRGNGTFLSMDSPSRSKTAGAASNVVTPPQPRAGTSSPCVRSSGARPSPMQAGLSYDTYFPPNHDAGMKLGADKYTGVGASPASQINSSELQSLDSSPSESNERVRQGGRNLRRGTAPPPANPIIFTDDDTSMVETASSAFATPQELQKTSSSVAGLPERASIVSRGSMTSQRSHGYSYYNSSAIDAEYFPLPSSASPPLSVTATSLTPTAASPSPSQRRQIQQQLQPFYRHPSATRTLTDVRANRQMPVPRSVAGVSTPLTRQSSVVGSDCFQSCRSFDELSSSSIGYLPLVTSLGGVSEARLRLLSGGYPASNAGGASSAGRPLYTCRSGGTPVTDLLPPSSPETAARGSVHRTTGARSRSGASLYSVQNTSRFHACSTPQTPADSAALLSTSNGRQLHLKQHASLRSGFGDAPASEGFFSLPPSTRDTFLDLPSVPASAAVDTSRQSTTANSATVSHRAETTSGNRDTSTAASASVQYSRSFGEAVLPSSSRSSSQSLTSGSAPSSAEEPGLTKTKVPAERQARSTPAATGTRAANNSSGNRKAMRSRKQYHTRNDFPPNPNTPPQAKLATTATLDAVAAATSNVHPSLLSPSAAAAAAMPPPVASENTSEVIHNRDTKAAAAPSTKGKASDGSTGAAVDSAAPQEGRLTQAYIEPFLPSSGAVAVANGGSTAAPGISSPSSAHSFSVVLSCRRDYLVAESSRGSWDPPRQPQPPKRHTVSRKLRLSSLGTRGGAPKARSRKDSAASSGAAARKGGSSALAVTPAMGAGGATGAREPSASGLAPLMTNPKPWVPSGRRVVAAASRVDPNSTGSVMKGAAAAAMLPDGTSRRSSLARPSSTPNENSGYTLAVKTSGRTGASARPPSAPATAATRPSSGSATKPDLGRKGLPRAPASSSVSRPSAANARKPKAKRAAANKSLKLSPSATPTHTSAAAAAAAGDSEPPDTEKDDSVVEYALCTGDEIVSETAGVEAVHTDRDGDGGGLQAAPAAAALPQPLPPKHESRAKDVATRSGSNADSSVQERLPQPHDGSAEDAVQPHLAGFRALTEVSIAATITSSEESVFLQPYTEAQLAVQLRRSAGALQKDGDSDQHLRISEQGGGGNGAVSADENAEDDRDAITADFAKAAAREALPSSDGDGREPYTVSTTSREETTPTTGSAERSDAESPTTRHRETSAPAKEDVVPARLVASAQDFNSEVGGEHAAPDLHSQSSSSASDSYATGVQMTTLR